MDINVLSDYCKDFCSLTPDKEQLLKEIQHDILPLLPRVTENFYSHLLSIESVKPFLEGRVDSLKATHLKWLESLFTHNFDGQFAAAIYHVGDTHVKVNLPVEFMAGAMTQLQQHLTPIIFELYQHDSDKLSRVLAAINSVLGYNLQIMQESYQSSSLTSELERFLKITGMSRTLFNNLAKAYK